jgi:hypothetical protein
VEQRGPTSRVRGVASFDPLPLYGKLLLLDADFHSVDVIGRGGKDRIHGEAL